MENFKAISTRSVTMEKGHRRLQYIGEHHVVKIFTSVHANLHERYVPSEYCHNASYDAKGIHIYGVRCS